MAKIPEGYLPPRELWPARSYTLPEYKGYPEKLNSTEELLGMVNRLGSSLKALGIEEADRVALRSPNIPPALVANFAVLKIGGIFLPTSGLFSPAEITHVFNHAEAKAV